MILKKGGICTLDEKGMKKLTVMDEAELIRRKSLQFRLIPDSYNSFFCFSTYGRRRFAK